MKSHKSKKRSVVKPGPIPAEPSKKHTLENWGDWGKENAPKAGEIRMLAEFRNGPTLEQGSPPKQIDHEKEYTEALQDPEFAKLCAEMGISAADAVRFHKLMQG
jgi:hypothetical protein